MSLPSLLVAGCERQPAAPDLSYVPPGGVLQPVTARDSWWTLAALPQVQAAKPGMTALDLCVYNFRTSVPAEINWYLRNKAGCTATTPDRRNYKFAGGEKIHVPGAVAAVPAKLPTSAEVEAWFVREMVPQRTTNAGFSPNRIFKSPQALLRGNNKADPNGLCGDTTKFVLERIVATWGDIRTSDGFWAEEIVWVLGSTLTPFTNINHVALVLWPQKRIAAAEFTWDSRVQYPIQHAHGQDAAAPEIINYRVLDLYYKRASSLGDWWRAMSSDRSGTLHYGL